MEILKNLKKFLFSDNRTLKTRMLIAVLACFSFVVTFMLAGPLELFFRNTQFFEYTVGEALLSVCLGALIALAVLFGISLLLRGKVFNWYISMLMGLSLAGYIQVIFFNSSVGLLDGTVVEWEHLTTQAVIGLAVWAVVIFIIFAIEQFNKKIWKNAVIFLSVLICVMQLTTVAAAIFTSEIDEKETIAVTSVGQYEYSSKNNVIVLVADSLDLRFAEEVMANNPEYYSEFDGFTWYKNAISNYSRSFPNVTTLFTGEHYMYDIPYEEYMENGWEDNYYIEDMVKAGYTPRLYTRAMFTNPDVEYMSQYCYNYQEAKRAVDYVELEKQMLLLSAYRTTPVALKSFFETDTTELNSAFALENSNQISNSDPKFYKGLTTTGLSINDEICGENGTFTYYHFYGVHSPYITDENCTRPGGKTSIEQATRGALTNINEFLRQLKELGIYDSATIFVTTDHGYTGRLIELDRERTITMFYKPANSRGEIVINESPQELVNVRATVMKAMGVENYTDYGTPVDEVKENDQSVRYFYMCGADEDITMREYNLITYKITGDARDFSHWEIVDKFRVKYPFLEG